MGSLAPRGTVHQERSTTRLWRPDGSMGTGIVNGRPGAACGVWGRGWLWGGEPVWPGGGAGLCHGQCRRYHLAVADAPGRRTHDRLERYRLPCRRGGSCQPHPVPPRGVGGSPPRGDGALHADGGAPWQKGDAPSYDASAADANGQLCPRSAETRCSLHAHSSLSRGCRPERGESHPVLASGRTRPARVIPRPYRAALAGQAPAGCVSTPVRVALPALPALPAQSAVSTCRYGDG
jgi:hypothetical protein